MGNAKRLKGGQNTKQLSKSVIIMEGYLRTSADGISPLMLSSSLTLKKKKAEDNSGNSYSRVSVLSSKRDSDILTCCFGNFKLCDSRTKSGRLPERTGAEAKQGQPDALPDHRLRNLNGRKVGGLGMHGQGGRRTDFQLKCV